MKFKGNKSLTFEIPLNIKILPLLRSITLHETMHLAKHVTMHITLYNHACNHEYKTAFNTATKHVTKHVTLQFNSNMLALFISEWQNFTTRLIFQKKHVNKDILFIDFLV